jgi:hypothetical protein
VPATVSADLPATLAPPAPASHRDGGTSDRRGRTASALLLTVLECARHRLGMAVHGSLSDGSPFMTDTHYDRAPGDATALPDVEQGTSSGVLVYTIGLALAVVLTAMSFWVANTSLLWAGGVSLGPDRPRDRANGHPPGVLPARHHGAGQHQQRDGAGLQGADRREPVS